MLLDSHLDEMLHFSKAYFADWDYGRSDVKLYGFGKTREHPENPWKRFMLGYTAAVILIGLYRIEKLIIICRFGKHMHDFRYGINMHFKWQLYI